MTRRTRGLAIGAAALTALGGGAALAAGAGGVLGGGEREALLNGVASKLGVTPEKLRDAISQALDERLDAAVKAGTITQAQADALRARLKAGGGGLLGPGLGRIGPGGPGGPGFHRGGMVLLRPQTAQAAAAYLGLSAAQLREQLADGKSLADIAKAQGKTADGLKAAMTAAVKKGLDAAVKAGNLTQAQADERLKELGERIDDAVAGTVRVAPAPGARGLPGFGRHPGPRLGRGPFGLRADTLQAAAAYLGVSAAQLRAQLGSGKTLADVARANGKTADGLKAAMTAAVKKELDAAVKAGKLTQAQADDVLSSLTQRLDRLIAGRPFFERRWERGPRAMPVP